MRYISLTMTYLSIFPIASNFNLYYLVVIFETKEKALLNTYLISSLQEPWSKGAFYLRKKRS
jgi:hypothetical protein